MLRGLLEGTAPPPAGSGLDGPSLVLFVQLPGGPRAPVAARRVGRRLQAALDRAFGREVTALLDGTGGRAIVPGGAEPPPALAGLLDGVCGPGVRLAAVQAETGARIPEAARTAARIVRVARACGHPAGLHRLDDVLLDLSTPRGAALAPAALLLRDAEEEPDRPASAGEGDGA